MTVIKNKLNNYLNLQDKRQKFISLNINSKKVENWSAYYCLEIFLPVLNNIVGSSVLQSNTINSVNALDININTKKIQLYMSILLKTNLSSIFFVNDATFYKHENLTNYVFITSFSNYTKYNKINYFTKIKKNISSSNTYITFYSGSTIFKGLCWVERELSEFFNIYYIGLSDTRRLLTDYTEAHYTLENYKTLSYNVILQDLYN